MSEFRKWAFWRRVQYGIGFVFIVLLTAVGSYALLRDTSFSCFDSVLNGDEIAVDCGGSCVRICAVSVIPPEVVWAESFKIVDGQYNAVAYIENKNNSAATPALQYVFEFYSNGELVTERSGVSVLPPRSIYPIFEGRINTNGREITETRLVIKEPELWQPATIGREQFRTSDINLSGAGLSPRLEATIENTELTPVTEVEIVATLFNEAGEPVTASQTYVDQLSPRSKTNIVFTWPNAIARTVKSCVIPTDVVVGIDLSGSMNNDGGTPPQPITNALSAASDFVEKLSSRDQASIVTFATNAQTTVTLSNNHPVTADIIKALTISPTEEAGLTNTAAALSAAGTELASERRNGDARRVLVLLTDGLATARGEANDTAPAEAITVAESIAESGVEVYSIGLGENVDTSFITGLASSEGNAYFAPSSSDLANIYERITSSLCESGTSRIDIVAKTGANFTPLE